MSVRQRQWKDERGNMSEAWVVDVKFRHVDGRIERVRRASPVNTRRGAEAFERQIRQALLEGSFGVVTKEVPTLADFEGRFLEHAETNNKPSTAKTKRDLLRKHLVPTFGRLRLDEIDSAKVEAFKAAKLKDGLTAKSVNNALACLGKLLNLAVEWGELKSAPKMKMLKAPKTAADFLSFEEAEDLAANAEPGRWGAMVVLALNTGLRIGEICALAWDCVDLTNGRLVVRRNVWKGCLGTPKGGRSREVPLNERAVAALRSIPRRVGSEWVFPQKDGGFIRNPQHACSEAIHRQAERAGLRAFGWHTLRHTFASHLVMKGVPLAAIKELLGHADFSTTMRYAHLSPNVAREAVRLLDERQRGTTGAQAKDAAA